ncbi:hypothetical protein QNH46_10260 [Paenibacillus woosongensis]|uniref:DUF4944 domain-containing protein n=1 Tax=Paenibacillus woosongensis TaxID=307580 RepID=A0AA95IBL5_9BACL|nr:hypothetical protein [Paenibacillus woosongensis]WHX50989.1 hypothetical protein QNH46_10260 [Paenibacillus woosongensis]
MKRTVWLLVGIIVITNVLWLYLFRNAEQPAVTANSGASLYLLHGTGEAWDVTDYKIMIAADKILRGHASLNYKGDPEQLSQSTFFGYKIYEVSSQGEKEVVYANEFHSNNGAVSVLDNVRDIGSLTGAYSYGELEKDKSNYESTSLELTWEDNKGERHTEIIELEIDQEIHITADE